MKNSSASSVLFQVFYMVYYMAICKYISKVLKMLIIFDQVIVFLGLYSKWIITNEENDLF